jgi:hypothetical protein
MFKKMKKLILQTIFTVSVVMGASNAYSQTPAFLSESPNPVVPGAVLRPQNSGSSTMQQIVYYSGAFENLYVHSWDVFGMPGGNGIAWTRTDAGGTILNQGDLQIPDAMDIDVVLYDDNGKYFVLAGYYNVATLGHYYDIYFFDPSGLIPISTGNMLSSSPSFGRINVDANTPYGLAITWCEPGAGIFVTTATLPGASFGPTVLMPGTSNYKDPDICISRYSGFLALQIVYRNLADNEIREDWWDFFDANAGGTGTITNEDVVITGNNYGVPRIDCAEQYASQKWAYVYSEYSVSLPFIGERIWANVLNTTFSPVPTTVLLSSTSYSASFYYENNPVVAYNCNVDQIHVGWITSDNTSVIPGTTDTKYVAEDILDPAGGMATAAGSYMMISNTPGGPAPVLAFSGQNVTSGFDGLYIAYSQYNTFFPGDYSMVYKNKPCTFPFYKKLDEGAGNIITSAKEPSVFPSPFNNELSINIPQKGNYDIGIVNLQGKLVMNLNRNFSDNEQFKINTKEMASGLYFIKIQNKENSVTVNSKIQKL